MLFVCKDLSESAIGKEFNMHFNLGVMNTSLLCSAESPPCQERYFQCRDPIYELYGEGTMEEGNIHMGDEEGAYIMAKCEYMYDGRPGRRCVSSGVQ